jgi:hypothetical protein
MALGGVYELPCGLVVTRVLLAARRLSRLRPPSHTFDARAKPEASNVPDRARRSAQRRAAMVTPGISCPTDVDEL